MKPLKEFFKILPKPKLISRSKRRQKLQENSLKRSLKTKEQFLRRTRNQFEYDFR